MCGLDLVDPIQTLAWGLLASLFRERITAECKKTLFVHPSTSMRLDCSLAGGPGYMVEGK